MKYSKIIIALVATGLALGTYITSQAAEDVRNSKHNLSASRNTTALGETAGGDVKFSSTTEVCVFCHTPHGGRTDLAGGAAPIWNRASSAATYQVYTSPNFDAAGVTPGTPKGVSVACLSCHDGTVAFDALINLPGRGGFQGINPLSAAYDKGTSTLVDTDNSFTETTAPFPNLGPDLRNDHPISMEIPALDPQFDEIRANLDTAELTAGHVSPLRRGAISTLPADKRDRIRAYPTNGDGKAYIECASCHNPHENTATRFLRYPSATAAELSAASLGDPSTEIDRNKGSLLCLSCHQK